MDSRSATAWTEKPREDAVHMQYLSGNVQSLMRMIIIMGQQIHEQPGPSPQIACILGKGADVADWNPLPGLSIDGLRLLDMFPQGSNVFLGSLPIQALQL